MGNTHVVPIQGTEVNAASRIIRLAYHQDRIAQAPTHDPKSDLDEGSEREVCAFYNLPWEPKEPATGPVIPQEEAHVQLHKEEVKVGKRQVVYGGVRVRKIIRTEVVQVPVELRREEIVIERVPAEEAGACGQPQALQSSEAGSAGTQADQAGVREEEIFIPLHREEPVVEKQSQIAEEVHVRKETKIERQTVSEQVRKEEAQIERAPARKRGKGKKQRQVSLAASYEGPSGEG